jgi:hypothetical protein
MHFSLRAIRKLIDTQEARNGGHLWKLRRDGHRHLFHAHGWGLHGYARKCIRGRECAAYVVEKHESFYVCRFILKEALWKKIMKKHSDSAKCLTSFAVAHVA